MADFTIPEFVTRLAAITIEVEHETHRALDEAARIVQKEAKDEIGHYQNAVGQFEEWAELANATKEERLRLGYTENDPLLREGNLRDSIERVVIGDTAYVGSNSPIAEYQELGTSRIPPRSFLGGALARKEHEIVEIIGSRIVSTLAGTDVVLPIPLGSGDLAPSEGDE